MYNWKKDNDNKIYGSIRYQYKNFSLPLFNIFEKNLRVDNDSTCYLLKGNGAKIGKPTATRYHIRFIVDCSSRDYPFIYLNISTSSSSSSMDGIMFWTFPQFSNLFYESVTRTTRVFKYSYGCRCPYFFFLFFFPYLFIYLFFFCFHHTSFYSSSTQIIRCKSAKGGRSIRIPDRATYYRNPRAITAI